MDNQRKRLFYAWSVALASIGGILIVLGLVLPDSSRVVHFFLPMGFFCVFYGILMFFVVRRQPHK